jgi:TPR repeat protein
MTAQELYVEGKKQLKKKDYSAAFDCFSKGAEMKDPDCIASLGNRYRYGQGTEKDLAKAVELYTQAADLGNARAMCCLGEVYRFSDVTLSIQWYEKAIKLGDTGAMCELGDNLIMDSAGDIKVYRRGVRLLMKSARLGNAQANLMIGEYISESGSNSQGRPAGEDKAIPYFRKAAELGEAEAMEALATDYEFGIGVTADLAEALKWYRKAADLGTPYAIKQIGYFYLEGKAIPQSYEEAAKWFEKGAELEEKKCMAELGFLYKEGKGVTKDEAKAFELFTKAVESETYPPLKAMLGLGLMYKDGLGVPKDSSQAIQWLRKAAQDTACPSEAHYELGCLTSDNAEAIKEFTESAKGGYLPAILALAHAYEDGKIVAQSQKDAFEWYAQAADKGDEPSAQKLGYYYLGIKDYPQAVRWLSTAAHLGDATAKAYVGYFYCKGLGVECNYRTSMSYFMDAADHGNAWSMHEVGIFYQSGLGFFPRNRRLAQSWLDKAVENGYQPNQYPDIL